MSVPPEKGAIPSLLLSPVTPSLSTPCDTPIPKRSAIPLSIIHSTIKYDDNTDSSERTAILAQIHRAIRSFDEIHIRLRRYFLYVGYSTFSYSSLATKAYS